MRPLVSLLLPLLLACANALADSKAALDVFKSGDYKSAIPLLKTECSGDKEDASVRAALLSALVYEGRLDDAVDLSQELAQRFADSPEALAARGEFHYYMGEIGEAEKLYKAAIKKQDATPRAYYGLSRLYRAASMYRSARLMCMRAHDLDPDDALLTFAFLHYASPELRRQKFASFIRGTSLVLRKL